MVEQAQRKAIQTKMQHVLARLGLPLSVIWTPDENRVCHGLIEESSRTIFLYDKTESEAWTTFTHEVFEWKLRETLRPYRETINGLIEIIERTCYKRKEEFLEAIPNIARALQQLLAELTKMVDPNLYDQILGLYERRGKKGYTEKVKDVAKDTTKGGSDSEDNVG